MAADDAMLTRAHCQTPNCICAKLYTDKVIPLRCSFRVWGLRYLISSPLREVTVGETLHWLNLSFLLCSTCKHVFALCSARSGFATAGLSIVITSCPLFRLAYTVNQLPASARVSTLSMQGVNVNADITIEEDAKFWKFTPEQDDRPAYYIYERPIQKSPADDREYRVIRLRNGLEAVLVHDAKTDKAAASLDVSVGYVSDPDDAPGLAHFCEHLLLMGSKQFPKENEYSEYLAKNNGDYNAFTTDSNTNFHFTVASNAFEGALKRFSAFFHSPLFSPSCTMRELNAIDSENSNNLQDDGWRTAQVMNHIARPGHPMRKFGTGNKKTLTEAARSVKSRSVNVSTNKGSSTVLLHGNGGPSSGPSMGLADSEDEEDGGVIGKETRRRLIDWWNKEYSAGRMSLVLVGRESLDELTHLAAVLFSPIKNRGQVAAPLILEDPFGKEELGTIVHIKTITDVYGVDVTFPVPYQAALWRVNPTTFLSRLIEHKGPGSLYAYLSKKGWITSLSTDVDDFGRGFSLFELSLSLTKNGFQNYHEVILVCFKYLSLLHDSALPVWVQEEIGTLDALDFRFEEKCSSLAYAQCITDDMKPPIPRSLILSGPRLTWAWDGQLVRDTLSRLVVENSIVSVMAQDYSTVGKTGPWSLEPWYETEYTLEKLKDKFVSAARMPNDIPELSLPKPNEFIPTNVEVEKVDASQPKKRPSLIKRTSLVEVWYKKDDQFWTPRAQVIIEARTPSASSSARAFIMTSLFVDLVNDSLTESSYDAEVAGLGYGFSSSMRGLSVIVSGYNDKLHILTRHVLEKVKNLDIVEDRLILMKEQAEQELANALLGDPLALSEYHLTHVLEDRDFTIEEQLAEISGVTTQQLHEHIQALLSQFKYNILVCGNLMKEDAFRIASMTEETLGSRPVPKDKIPHDRARLLPKPCNYIWELPVPNPDQVNSSVAYYCHIGSISDARLRTTCSLIDQVLQEPTFNVLRTQEQLGYVVYSATRGNVESLGWGIGIQSEKDPKYLESRIDAFLVHMRCVLEEMDPEEYEEHEKAIVHEWTKKHKNVFNETAHFWSHISDGYYDFARLEHDAELIMSVTKEDVLAMFKEFIDPASLTRSKLSMHMRPQSPPDLKLSARAAEGFLAALRKAGITVDEEEFESLCEDEPPVSSVRSYWEDALLEESDDKAEKLLAEFDRLSQQYPASGQGTIELSSNVAFIEDSAAFRQTLALSGPAKPVEDFEVE